MEAPTVAPVEVLDETCWRARRARHEQRVDAWVGPHLERRQRRVAHPVEDFLFSYYSQRPAALRRWHPGYGVALAGGEEYLGLKGYGVVWSRQARPPGEQARPPGEQARPPGDQARPPVGVAADHLASRRPLLESTRRLLVATAGRAPQFGCLGLHEWAMVYRLGQDDVRHAAWPLRLGPSGTDAVVESHRIACSHFDAYRFFTEAARPLNLLRPASDDRAEHEQPGCLHAGMDLYKHAFRLSPLVGSDLVADCFELAREIRVLDMRASPYDLTGLGYEPVAIETAAGKQEYIASQRDFAERAAPLRRRLVEQCDRLLAVG